MFAAAVLLCFMSSLFATEPWLENLGLSSTDELKVTITIDGENALNYVRLMKSPIVSESLRRTGALRLKGVLVPVGDGRFLVRHVAIIKIVGESLRLLIMESTVAPTQITEDRATTSEQEEPASDIHLHLTVEQPVEITVRKLVGEFPDSVRYH